ncbi:TIGR02594 family protein [Tardiphaga sp. 813_E8_N1_3]|uniref:TIGR02594 family protein n=1 Tax=Tardiphaga sp. 813_E8_N1_3 TaxID=3240760 RepID=UPI003F2210BC
MVQFFAYRRALRISALAVCSAAVLASVSPASARPQHGASRHSHHVGKYTHSTRHHVRHRARYARRSARVEQQAPSFGDSANFNNANASMNQPSGGFGGSGIVDAARSFIGRGNPTARGRLWCAAFMNLVLKRTGHQGTGSDMARSFSSYGQRISGPQVGAIAVMSRGRRGGHVGVVSGVDAKGNPIIVSGNHGNRVAESVYSRGRIYAYVMPTS